MLAFIRGRLARARVLSDYNEALENKADILTEEKAGLMPIEQLIAEEAERKTSDVFEKIRLRLAAENIANATIKENNRLGIELGYWSKI